MNDKKVDIKLEHVNNKGKKITEYMQIIADRIDLDSTQEPILFRDDKLFIDNRSNCKLTISGTISDPYPLFKHYNPIKKVIFNDPATIVFWKDGTKTVVKTHDGDKFDKMTGLAMALSKKYLGNNYDYYKVFKRWIEK